MSKRKELEEIEIKDIPQEYAQLINEHFWELIVKDYKRTRATSKKING